MTRKFVHTKPFDKQWVLLGGNDDSLGKLQHMIQKDPTAHPVIKGTGGVRKMRFSLSNTGKSGGIRVIYSDFPERGKVLLIKVYSKHEQEDLTESEIKTIKRLSQEPT